MITKEDVFTAIADAWWKRKPKIVEFVNKHLTVEGARIFTPEHTYFADHFPRWFGNVIGNCPVLEPHAYMIAICMLKRSTTRPFTTRIMAAW